jgi:L-threonylcarbamoyladenylate synthase
MEIIKVNPRGPEPEAIEKARVILLKGGVIVYPTDTVYGLGAVVSNQAAVERIKDIKGRSNTKPLSIMVRDFEMAERYGELPPGAEKYLPGPYTLLLAKKPLVPEWISSNDMVGIRIPDCQFTKALMAGLEEAITTTSANLTNYPPVHSVAAFLEQVGERAAMIDLIVDAGELAFNPPSTLINMSG